MQVEMHVEGDTITELEANARAAIDKVADGRPYTFKVEQAHGSARAEYPNPVARMAAGYRSQRLSGFVTATFEETRTA